LSYWGVLSLYKNLCLLTSHLTSLLTSLLTSRLTRFFVSAIMVSINWSL